MSAEENWLGIRRATRRFILVIGAVTVTATSVADTTKSGTSAVTVLSTIVVSGNLHAGKRAVFFQDLVDRLLKHQKVVREPELGAVAQDADQFLRRLQQIHPRAAASLRESRSGELVTYRTTFGLPRGVEAEGDMGWRPSTARVPEHRQSVGGDAE